MIDIKPLKIIHGAFCLSILLFATVVCFVNKDLLVFDFTLSHSNTNFSILSFIAVIFTVLAMNLGTYLFNKIIERIDLSASSSEKFAKYQTAFIIKCALLESTALFSLVMCLITFNFYFIIVAAFPLVALWLIKPTAEKIDEALQIQDNNSF